MKKVVLGLVLGLGFISVSKADYGAMKHDLSPQYRVWKSSFIGEGVFSGVQIATQPIIFRMVVGSGTTNAGLGAFTLLQSTGMTSMSSDASTKTYIKINSDTSGGDDIGTAYDILVQTHSYFNKTGVAPVGYLYDYLNPGAGFNRYPKD